MTEDIFTLTAEGFVGNPLHRKVTVDISSDTTAHDFLEACRTLALGLGYLEVSWNQALRDRADDLTWAPAEDL